MPKKLRPAVDLMEFKCRTLKVKQMSWASSSQFLQPSFLASSSTPSIHLGFVRQLLTYAHVILKEEERENLEVLDDIVLSINYKEIR
jgi:hypothetical protein